MAASFPGLIASILRVTRSSDSAAGAATEPVSIVNKHSDEIEAIETELGTNPKGSAGSVGARIAAVETSDAGKVAKSIVTAKGDVLVASASATVSKVGVGTDGQVLTADSTQATGVKWSTPATGGVSSTRAINTSAPLTGGGDLSADRTLGISVGTTTGTVAAGDDSRITGATPKSLYSAKGTLLAASAASTPAALAVGTDGQFLIADSTQTSGVKWGNSPDVPKSLYSGKGVILAGSGASTPAALAAGSDGQVLTLDSAQANGVKWATPATGGSNKDWFNAFGGTWEAGQSAAGAPLLSPNLRIPPNGTYNITSQYLMYFRTSAQAAQTWQGLAFFCTAKPGTVAWQAGLYTLDGTRRAVATGKTAADLSISDITYVTWDAGATYSAVSGTEYVFALWFNFASGTLSLASLNFPASFISQYMTSSPLLAAPSTSGTGLPASGATFTSGALPSIPWVAAV